MTDIAKSTSSESTKHRKKKVDHEKDKSDNVPVDKQSEENANGVEKYANSNAPVILGGSVEPLAKFTDDNNAIFSFNVSKLIGDEYVPLFLDIVRMICIHTMIQLMCVLGSEDTSFFSRDFVTLLLYIILGVMIFWLVVRRIINIH